MLLAIQKIVEFLDQVKECVMVFLLCDLGTQSIHALSLFSSHRESGAKTGEMVLRVKGVYECAGSRNRTTGVTDTGVSLGLESRGGCPYMDCES